MATFKFDSATCFLTYAQSDLSIDQVYQFLQSIKPVTWARICKENHADGGTHIHAVARWSTRVQSRNSRFLDIGSQHPNIQTIRSIKHALNYVAKDGEFEDFGTVPSDGGSDINLLEAAATCSEAEYYKLCLQKRIPYQYANKFWQLGAKHSCEIGEDYVPDLTRESMELMLTPLPLGTTVLVGASGIGKTSWAKRLAPKPALWVRHLDVLRTFRTKYHKSIIFDDMSFLHLPRETQIHLTDQTDEAHIHCRYGHAVIPANTPKIFTANNYPFLEDPAIDRRVTKIIL